MPRPSISVLRREAGFTLIEIMVVVLILGMLAAMVAHNVSQHADTAKLQKATMDVRQIAGAVRLFYVDTSRLPSLEELVTPTGTGKAYLEELPPDPWSGDYLLTPGDRPGEFVIASAGPNRIAGDDDDIASRSAASRSGRQH